jgi:ribosomal protein L24
MEFFMVRRLSLLIILAFVLINLSGAWALDNSSDTETKKKVTPDQGKTNAQSPVLNISPREIDLGVIGPEEGVKGTFVLKNVGSGSCNWHADGAEGWSSLDEKKLSGVLKNDTESLDVHISSLKKALSSGTGTEGKNLIQLSLEANSRIAVFRKNLPFGTYREALKFASNGGTRTIFIRFELASRDIEPKIDVDPVRIDFGTVKPGETANRRIKVTNKGQEILRWQVSAKSGANAPSSEAGRYSSFFNGDIKGSGVYLPPSHLKDTMELTGKWVENNGLPSSSTPSSAIRYRFWGSGIIVFLSMEDEESMAFQVDDKHVSEPDCNEGQKEPMECVLAEGLPQGQHVLTITNKSGSVVVQGVRIYSRDVKKGTPGLISIFPTVGDTTREIDYVNVMVNTRGQSPGFYDENIIFNSNGGKAVIEVSLEISVENKMTRVVDIYRYVALNDYLLTANPEADAHAIRTKAYKKQGIAFRLFGQGVPGTTPFYRWYSAEKNDHFYSYYLHGEGKSLQGYTYEGVIGNIATSRLTNTRELYRWYNPSSGRHFYTTDPNGEAVSKRGYRFDGIAGYVR